MGDAWVPPHEDAAPDAMMNDGPLQQDLVTRLHEEVFEGGRELCWIHNDAEEAGVWAHLIDVEDFPRDVMERGARQLEYLYRNIVVGNYGVGTRCRDWFSTVPLEEWVGDAELVRFFIVEVGRRPRSFLNSPVLRSADVIQLHNVLWRLKGQQFVKDLFAADDAIPWFFTPHCISTSWFVATVLERRLKRRNIIRSAYSSTKVVWLLESLVFGRFGAVDIMLEEGIDCVMALMPLAPRCGSALQRAVTGQLGAESLAEEWVV